QLNEIPEGWVQAMGMTITHATKDEVRAELTVGRQHLQGYGIVHGGVHCGIIETLSSMAPTSSRASGGNMWSAWRTTRASFGLCEPALGCERSRRRSHEAGKPRSGKRR